MEIHVTQRSAELAITNFISNKREWNTCFTKFPIFDVAVWMYYKCYLNLINQKSMLLLVLESNELESNEMCNALRPCENSILAFKYVLRCCANIIATGTDFKGELSRLKVLLECGNCSSKFESSWNCESNRLFFLLWQRYIFSRTKNVYVICSILSISHF